MTKCLLFAPLLVSACLVGDGGDDQDELDIDPLAATAKLTVVQHNIEKQGGALNHALDAGKNADAITLQEVCPAQLASLRATAQQKGWTLAAQEVPHVTCDDKTTKPSVVAIWTGGSNGVVSTVSQLGDTPNQPGQAACIAFTFKKVPSHICSVKLISTDQTDGGAETIRQTQTRDLRKLARDQWFGGKNELGVIAGDFNANTNQPSIDFLYAPQIGGKGDFTEYNRGDGNTRDGQPTAHGNGDVIGAYDKKIDYVFFSTNRVALNPGPHVQITADDSDHDMLVSSAMIQKH